MSVHFDEKGKYYTEVISKDVYPVILQMTTHRIRGLLHVRAGERIKDELNLPEQFLAITDAQVYAVSGELMYRCEFMTVNKSQIVWAIPQDDLDSGTLDPGRGEGERNG